MQNLKPIPGCSSLNDLLAKPPGDKLQSAISRVARGFVALHRPDLQPFEASTLAKRAATVAWEGVVDQQIKNRKDIVMAIYSVVCPTIGPAWPAR